MATVEITEASLAPTLEENEMVFIDFWADWCQPCKQFAPTYDAASEKHEDVVFAKVDTEAEQQLAAAAQISSIPTLMAFREQVLVFSQPGALNGEQLEELIGAVRGIDMKQVHAEIAEAEKQEAEQGTESTPAESAGADNAANTRPV